jgi:hypothetical protein
MDNFVCVMLAHCFDFIIAIPHYLAGSIAVSTIRMGNNG